MTLSKKKTKIWLASLGSVLLATLMVLSGVGIYFKLNPAEKVTKASPLDFSIDAWDGKSFDEYEVAYAGRNDNTRTIDSAESFMYFIREVNTGSTFEGLTVYLNKSIDLKGVKIKSIGSEEKPFKGTFDGGFYSIYNLTVEGNGLFAQTENATIKNLGLYNLTLKSDSKIAGGLVGKAIDTTIDNTFVNQGKIKGERVAGLVGEYIISENSSNINLVGGESSSVSTSNVKHKISNSFVNTEFKANDFAGLVHTITNNSNNNRLLITDSYYTEAENAVSQYEETSLETNKVIKAINKRSFIDAGWKYQAKYEKGENWCDYDYLEGSKELEFEYPVQSGFVKVFLTGSHYEVVISTGEQTSTEEDLENANKKTLSEAFTQVNNSTKEAEINLLVEKIFMEARAEANLGTNVTVNAVKDTTIVRGEHNEDSMFVATTNSKIVLGDAVSTYGAKSSTSTITLDGNREQVEKENLDSGALVVGYGGEVEIHENVVLQNNVNTNVGYGGGVLIYNAEEVPVINGTIQNCSAEYGGGGICIVGSSVGNIGSIIGCSTDGNGGGISIVSEMEEGSAVSAVAKLYGDKKYPTPVTTITSATFDINAYQLSGNTASLNGGAIYFNIPSSSTTAISIAGRTTSLPIYFSDNDVQDNGGAIYIGSIGNTSSATLTFRNVVFATNSCGGSGGAIYSARGAGRYLKLESGTYFDENYSTNYGGAIYTASDSMIIQGTDPEFYGNYAVSGGGAISAVGRVTFSDRALFESNSTDGDGGAIRISSSLGDYGYGGQPELQILFKGNYASGQGGAISSAGPVYLICERFENNYSYSYGGAIFTTSDVTVSPTDSSVGVNFISNTAESDGGAIYCYGNFAIAGDSRYTYAYFYAYGNTSYCNGSVIASEGEVYFGTMSDVGFYNNTADGLAVIYSQYQVTFANRSCVTFEGNSSPDYDGEIVLAEDCINFSGGEIYGSWHENAFWTNRCYFDVDPVWSDNGCLMKLRVDSGIEFDSAPTCYMMVHKPDLVAYDGWNDGGGRSGDTVMNDPSATAFIGYFYNTGDCGGLEYLLLISSDGSALECYYQDNYYDESLIIAHEADPGYDYQILYEDAGDGYSMDYYYYTIGETFRTISGCQGGTGGTFAYWVDQFGNQYNQNTYYTYQFPVNLQLKAIYYHTFRLIVYNPATGKTTTTYKKVYNTDTMWRVPYFSSLGVDLPRNGWSFYGWSTSATSYTRTYSNYDSFDIYSMSSKETVLYAVYSRIVYVDRTCETNDSVGHIGQTTQYWNGYGTTAGTHYNYVYLSTSNTFTNWSAVGFRTDSSASAPNYYDGDYVTPTMPNNCYQIFSRTLTIKYSMGGGTPAIANQTKTIYYSSYSYSMSSQQVKLSSTYPTKTGYSFECWEIYDGSGNGNTYWPGNMFNAGLAATASSFEITASATWSPILYNLQFIVDDGLYSSEDAWYDSSFTMPEAPSKPGLTFAGWALASDSTDIAFESGQSVLNLMAEPGVIDLYAVYYRLIDIVHGYNQANAGSYNLYWNSAGNVLYIEGYGSEIPEPDGISGWGAAGWRDDDTAGRAEYSKYGELSISMPTTLYAVYSATLKISFYANGGTGTAPSTITKTLYYNSANEKLTGDTFSMPDCTFNRTGYLSTYWVLDSASYLGEDLCLYPGDDFVPSDLLPVTAGYFNIKAYMGWTEIGYSITFNANGGTGTTSGSSFIGRYDHSEQLPANGYTKTGHDFAGWKLTTTEFAYAKYGTTSSNVSTAITSSTIIPDKAYVINLTTTNNYTVTLTAQWTAQKFTVTWKSQDGNITLETDNNVTYGTKPTYNGSTPTKSSTAQYSYTFAGWSTSANAESGTVAGSLPTVSGKTTYYAAFSKTTRTYTVTWKSQDGLSTYETDSGVAYGTKPTYNGSTPTKAETAQYTYAFAGWSTARNAESGTAASSLSAITGLTTYYAAFSKTLRSYTVTIQSNNINYGTVSPTSVASVPYGTKITVNSNKITVNGTTVTASAKTTTGYTNSFSSWSVVNNYEVIGDKTIEATFTQSPNIYKVTLNNQSATTAGTAAYWYKFNTCANSIYYYSDANCTTKLGSNSYTITKPAKTGYTFGGYFTSTGGEGTQYVDASGGCINNLYSAVANNSTLYAYWIPNKYKVTLDNQGATTAGTAAYWYKFNTCENNIYYYSDANCTTKLGTNSYTITKPTKTGYTFGGYFTKTGGAGTQYVDASGGCINNLYSAVASNSTLYAYWTINKFTVTWKSQDGSTTLETDTNVSYGTAPSYNGTAPTKAATAQYTYAFAGWSTSANSESGTAVGSLPTVTGAVTYYAAFSKTLRSYTVTIESNNINYGTVDKASVASVPYGTKITVSSNKITVNGTTVTASAKSATGYTTLLLKWSVANNYEVTGAVTITATFIRTAYTYTIKYYNGSTEIGSSTHTYGTAKALTTWATLEGTVTNSSVGWRFNGWATANNTYDGTYADGGSVSNLTSSNGGIVNLYAVYERDIKFVYNSPDNYGYLPQQWNPYGTTVGTHVEVFQLGTPPAKNNWDTKGWRDDTTASTAEFSSTTQVTPSMSGVYYAVYSREQFIYYNGNGSTSGSTAETTKIIYYNAGVLSDRTMTLASNGFTKTGYTFSKWAEGSTSGTQYSAGASYTPSSYGVSMYAIWTANTYTVKYNGNGNTGGSTASSTHTYDTAKALTANGFTKTGYSFAGWNTKADGTGTNYADKASVTNLATSGEVTLYAKWTINSYTYTLTYGTYYGAPMNATNFTVTATKGTVTGNITTTSAVVSASYSTEAITITVTRDDTSYNYNLHTNCLGGWTNHTNTFSFTWTPTASASGAVHVIQLVKQSAIAGTGISSVDVAIQHSAESSWASGYNNKEHWQNLGVQFNAVVKAGYTFKGWYTSSNGSGTAVSTSTSYTKATYSQQGGIRGSYTYYAFATANTYTVKYDGNTNTGGSTASSTHTYDTAKALTANGFTKTGYAFAGWNTKADGTGTSYTDKQSVTNLATSGTVTLYAQWSINTFTVTWKSQDGSTTLETDNNVAYGTKPSYDGTAPTKAATAQYTYTFVGWSTSANSESGTAVGSLPTVSGAVTYYAAFSKTVNKYTITWKNHDGTVLETDTNVAYGATPTYNGATPTKAATAQYTYTHSGWSPAVSSVTGNATYTATFSSTVNNYTVSVVSNNTNYGTVDKASVASVPYGTKITVSSNKITVNGTTVTATSKAVTGHTVTMSWSVANNYEVKGNVTVTATFVATANTYTVSYSANGGSGTMTSDTVTYGQPYSAPECGFTPPTGYEFSCWKGDNGSSWDGWIGRPWNWAYTVDVVLIAQWKAKTYTVSYNANGGTGTMAADTATYNVEYTAPACGFTPPTGYSFDHWNESADGKGVSWAGYVGRAWTWTYDKSITLYAIWKPNTYTVTYNANGGTGTTASSTHTYDTAKALTANGFTKTGYTFANWNTKADGTGTSYANGASVTNLATSGSITLYAQWTANTYTVKYNGNGNTGGSTSSSTHTYDTAKALTANGYTKTGYTFAGWNTKADGTGTSYADKASVTNLATSGEVTLYAQWSINKFTVTWKSQDGSTTLETDTNVSYGTAPSYNGTAPTKSATAQYTYTFAGWSTSANSESGTVVGSLPTVTGAVTYYAAFSKTVNKYTVTIQSNNTNYGTVDQASVANVPYGTKITVSSNKITVNGTTVTATVKSKTGYSTYFDSWSVSNNYEVIGNKTITATFTQYANEYLVEYDGNGATSGTTATSYHTYDVEKALTTNGFTKTGYSFNGWNTKADGTGTSYADKASVKNLLDIDGYTITLYAQWTANTYTVSYNANGGTGTTASSSHTYDVAKALTTNGFTRTGYTFAGWNTKADGTGTSYADKASVKNLATSGTVTLYAQWTANGYTVNYYNGSTKIGSSTHTYGTAKALTTWATLEGTVTNSSVGWSFAGWATANNTYSITYSNGNTVTNLTSSNGGTVNLYAVYSRVISFDWHHDKSSISEDQEWNPYGTTSGTHYNSVLFVEEGDGWRDDYTPGPAEYAIGDPITPSMPNQYYVVYLSTLTITYNGNGSTGGSTANTTKTIYEVVRGGYESYYSSKEVTLANNGFTKTGYTFSKWAQGSTSGTQYSAGASYTPSSYNVTMYAIWTANTYTVKYNGNGNTGGSTASSTHTYDTAKALTANGFTKTGYSFAGWNTKADGTGTSYADKASVTNLATSGEVTLYAKWTANTYTVAYNANGGTGTTASSTHTYDVEKTLTTNGFTKTGYSFNGWNTKADGTGTSYADKASVKNLATSGTVTLYAQWAVLQSNFNKNWQSLVVSALGINRGQIKTIQFVSGTTLPSGFNSSNFISVGSTARNNETVSSGVVAYWYKDSSDYYHLAIMSPSGGTIYAPLDCSKLFYYSTSTTFIGLTTLTFDNFDTSSVTDMSHMFRGCSDLVSLNLSSFNTSSVTDMSHMFRDCSDLVSLNLTGINTSSVTNMREMFYHCLSLTSLDLSGFNTSSVTNMRTMFYECSSLTSLNLTGWNTSKVTDMKSMFYDCTSLTILDISSFDLSNCELAEIHITQGVLKEIKLPKTISSCPLEISVDFDMIVTGTQTKVVSKGTATTIASTYQNKTLVKAYTLTANANNGAISSTTGWSGTGTTATRYVAYNGTISDLPTVSRTGYTLKGWYSATSGGTQYTTTSTLSEDKTIYAQWTSHTYTINYYNGSTKLGSSTHTYDSAKALTTWATLEGTVTNSSVGWSFAGWATANNTCSITHTDGKSVTNLTSASGGTVDLYAVYNRNISMVSNINGSESLETPSQYWNPYGTTAGNHYGEVSLSTPVAITNWTTLGWRDDSTATTSEYAAATKITPAMPNLYFAVYSRILTITYNGNGSTSGSTANTTKTIYYNTDGEISDQTVTLANCGFSKTGYYFDLWASSVSSNYYEGGASYNPNLTVTDSFSITMTAVWQPNTYTVVYNGNGNTGGSTANSTHTYDTAKELTANGFTKTGYTFTGWNTAHNGTGTTYTDKQSVKNLTTTNGGTVTLYAQWTINLYNVKIVSNNTAYGTVDSDQINAVPHGTQISVSGNTILFDGATVTATPTTSNAQYTYKFASWSVTDGQEITGEMTITATFTRVTNQYTVTFVDDKTGFGSIVSSSGQNNITVNYGTAIAVSGNVVTIAGVTFTATPTSADAEYTYSFKNWTNVATVTKDLTITANFDRVVNTYTVTINTTPAGYGTVDKTSVENVPYGTTLSVNGNKLTINTTTPTTVTGTPTARSDQYTYSFKNWTNVTATVQGNLTVTANFDRVVNNYDVTIKVSPSGFGSLTQTKVESVPYGTTLSVNGNKLTVNTATPTTVTATPTPADAQYTYKFDSWTDGTTTVKGKTEVTANFSRTVNTYAVVWKSQDGSTTYETDPAVEYGQAPSYDGTTPTKDRTAQYTYTFEGWSTTANSESGTKEAGLPTITGAVTYYAAFSKVVNKYTVSLAVKEAGYGTVSQASVAGVPYGTKLTANNNVVTIYGTQVTATPTAANAQYTYTFANWTNGSATVQGDLTVTANFTRTVNTYTITWKNEDGTVLETDTGIEYGKTPTYDGATPTKAADVKYTYTFDKWAPNIATVTGNATYTATYSKTINKYTITFVDDKTGYGSVVSSSGKNNITIEYETPISISGNVITIGGVTFTATPKTRENEYSYEFRSWSNTTTQVLGNATFTANFYRMVDIDVQAEGVDGNTYGVNVYNESNTLLNATPYKEKFRLETDKVYSIKVVSDLIANETNNKHQILRVYLDGTLKLTQDGLVGSVSTTICNKETISITRTIKFEFVSAHFLAVSLEANTIGGITVNSVNNEGNIVISKTSKGGYIVADGTVLTFTVNSTPKSNDSVYTFIGFNYTLNGVSSTIGVNGGTDIVFKGFTQNSQYTLDKDVGTYSYSVDSGANITELEVVTVSSTVIQTINTTGLTGTMTLTSEHGFNKVVDASTTSLILYAGTWKITTTMTLAEVKAVFSGFTVTQNATTQEITVVIA